MADGKLSQPAPKRTKRSNSGLFSGDVELGSEFQQPTADSRASPAPGSSSRTGLACEACRLRKTRCVGFPTCTWCQRRRQSCIRGQNSQTSPLDDWGNQILGAISRARNEILGASSRLYADQPLNHASAPLPGNGNGNGTGRSSPQWSTWPHHRGGQGCFSPMSSAESILQWDILQAQLPSSIQFPVNATDACEPERSIHSKASADTSSGRLRTLEQRFEHQFLARYPIISRPWLARCVRDVAESDGGWTAEACLVFLVCAIASLCDCSTDDTAVLTPQTISRSPSSVISGPVSGMLASRRLAYQYWTMAKRRLGWALDEPVGLLTAQCLCLAGFWHLQNSAPRRARNMFYRAAESIRGRTSSPNTSDEERHLARFIHLLCADLLERLNIELELSPEDARKDGTDEILLPNPRPSLPAMSLVHNEESAADPAFELTDNLQQLCSIRKDVNRLLASISSISSWLDLYLLLAQATDIRSRLNHLTHPSTIIPEEISHSPQFSQTFSVAVLEDVCMQKQELAARLLRVYLCLHLHLSPLLLQKLDSGANPSPLQSPQYILAEIADLADECLSLTVEAMRSHLDRWQRWDSLSSHPSTPHHAASGSSSCHHLEAEFSYRFSYVGCLMLLAVYYAKTKASCGEVDFAHCHSLKLPAEWRSLVAGHTRVLLSHEEGTNTWRCGRLLSQFDME
ncbi:hypothetical protein ACJZ2D_012220 [Fusarium nematophilum]